MKISVIGLGYVGAVAAAGLAGAGHDVLGVDIDRARVESLSCGKVPMYEPGLEARIADGITDGSLRFSHPDDIREPLGHIALIATGTPPRQSGAADLSQVRSALDWIKSKPHDNLVVVVKSTVPPGTGCKILAEDLRGTGIRYASNPEFLREGRAVQDWDSPDRIVIGAEPGDRKTVEAVKQMHSGVRAPFIVTDITSAEMTKYASNAFLATRISFINEIAALCDRVGASIDDVSEGLAMDPRTGNRIYAGGVEVQAFDPRAAQTAARELPSSARIVDDPAEAAAGTQAVVILTEWNHITDADWNEIARCMRPPRFVFDGRNCLSPQAMEMIGFEYHSVGRNNQPNPFV